MIRTSLIAAVAVMATGAAVAAPVTIDNFSTTSFQVVGAPSLGDSPTNPATTSGPTSDAIGGNRTITAERTLPVGTANAFGQQVQSVVTGGMASVSLGANTEGTVQFDWNAGGADLVDGTNTYIGVNVLSTDLAGVTYTLNVDGESVTKTATTAGQLVFDFSEFATANFTNVSAISLLIGGPTSFDTTFDFIGADGGTVVPLPAAGFLVLGGLGALGAVRARRKKA